MNELEKSVAWLPNEGKCRKENKQQEHEANV